jgi:lipopolysaccharide export system protein LptA
MNRPNFSVERIRIGLLAGAGLLVVVIAAFLGYAHYRAHRFLTGLPGKLGMDIRQETNGFTYSQSVKGKTIYTIHAAKAIQRKDGKVTLDDVGIVLYGRGEGGKDAANRVDRVDRIYGSEFEYDQNAGIVRAMGLVHMDMQAPAPTDANAKANYAMGHESKSDLKDDRIIHVKTSGLVFLQKLGVAATDQDLEFEVGGMTGHAHGADYNSDTGLLILQSAVKVNGLKNGEPVVLTAARAELDRHKQQTVLTHAVYTILGGTSGVRVARGEKVTAYLRPGGSVEWAQAEGNVSLTEGTATTVSAARGEVHLNPDNQPQAATFAGGVKYGADEPFRQSHGEAAAARAAFSKVGRLEQMTLTGGVHLHERTRSTTTPHEVRSERDQVSRSERDQVSWSERDLVSSTVDLAMIPGGSKNSRLELREAKASGDARLTVINPTPSASTLANSTSSTLSGDLLIANFVTRDGASHLHTVHGAGHTRVVRISDLGAKATSSGDTLDAEFHATSPNPSIGPARRTPPDKTPIATQSTFKGNDEIVTATQQGHVVLTNLPVAKLKPNPNLKPGTAPAQPATPTEQRATADRAVYTGSNSAMTLTGAVQIADAGNTVWADRVVLQQQTGDATADGSVRASYLQPNQKPNQKPNQTPDSPAAEAVHVLAARAELKHDVSQAFFYGGAQPARLWQGASQVTAPLIQFDQKNRLLVARGNPQDKGLAVHAVFIGSTLSSTPPSPIPPSPPANAPTKAAKKPAPIRIASHEMTYNDLTRRADFSGGVLVENADGTMRAQQGTVFLQPAKPEPAGGTPAAKSAAPGSFMGGSVERMLASGGVDIVQPGRRATGEQVVYTASDGMFVMTGTSTTPPRMMDEARGAITGASLRFHAGDNSVVVSSGSDNSKVGAGQRVRSETRVKQ